MLRPLSNFSKFLVVFCERLTKKEHNAKEKKLKKEKQGKSQRTQTHAH